jgi:hypothetical protein
LEEIENDEEEGEEGNSISLDRENSGYDELEEYCEFIVKS